MAQGPCLPSFGGAAHLGRCLVSFELQPLGLLGPGLGLQPSLSCPCRRGGPQRGPWVHTGSPSPVTHQQLLPPFPEAAWCLATATPPGISMSPVSPTCLRCVIHDPRQSFPSTAAPPILPSDCFRPAAFTAAAGQGTSVPVGGLGTIRPASLPSVAKPAATCLRLASGSRC